MTNQKIDETPVSFPDWNQILDGDFTLESTVRLHHRQAIIYTHVLNKPGLTVKSPLDLLGGSK